MKLLAQIHSALLLLSVANADLLFESNQDIDCKGVDFKTCSQGEKDFFAEQVEATFNKINMPSRYLSDTKWVGARAEGKGRRLGERSLNGGFESGRGGGCTYCRTDDAFVKGGHGGFTSGSSGCTYCRTDDAFVKGGQQDTVEDTVTWGQDLTDALAQSGFPCFQSVQMCIVNLYESPGGLAVVAAAKKTNQNDSLEAAMRVQCQSVNWASLTSAEKHFAAAKLQRAFNDMAENMKTTQLQEVHWETGAEQMASLLDYLLGSTWGSQGSLGYFRGGLIGSSTAVDMKNLLFVKNNYELVDRWADIFESLLADGPYSSLSRANSCQIQMEVVPSSIADIDS